MEMAPAACSPGPSTVYPIEADGLACVNRLSLMLINSDPPHDVRVDSQA
jgi:hypothetical protein